MKIAIHQPRLSYYIGGGERVPLEQAKYLARLGHKVTIVTTDADRKSSLFRLFVEENPLVRIEAIRLSDKLKYLYKTELGQNRRRVDAESMEFGRLTKKYYKENYFDIVATHYTVDALKIPVNQNVVLHLHGCPARKRLLDEKSLKRANHLSAVAKYVGDFWKKMYNLKKLILLSYNGIDNKFFHRIGIDQKYDLLFVGRLIKIKGVDDLLRAAASVSKRRPNLKIVIVGAGPEKNKLKALAGRLDLESNIRWQAHVGDTELLNLYNSSKISIFPSTAKEGVLTTMLEAAACGSAIITTDCCGMPEFLTHDQSGLLVRPNQPSDLAASIDLLLGDKESLRKKLGGNAKIAIDREWTWEKQINDLDGLLTKFVKG